MIIYTHCYASKKQCTLEYKYTWGLTAHYILEDDEIFFCE